MLVPISLLALAFLAQTPDATLPPAGAHLSLTAEAVGVQIYRCTPQPDGTLKWVYEAPEANLFNAQTNQRLGVHSAGPTWHWNDGSEIVGKVLESAPSKDPNAIPWLLLETHSTGGPGALAGIAYVRRANTQAGTAPSYGCNVMHRNGTIRVPYEATYTFYTASQSQ